MKFFYETNEFTEQLKNELNAHNISASINMSKSQNSCLPLKIDTIFFCIHYMVRRIREENKTEENGM